MRLVKNDLKISHKFEIYRCRNSAGKCQEQSVVSTVRDEDWTCHPFKRFTRLLKKILRDFRQFFCKQKFFFHKFARCIWDDIPLSEKYFLFGGMVHL